MKQDDHGLTNHEITICLAGGAILGPFRATWSKETTSDVRELTMSEALNEALTEEMELDAGVFVVGVLNLVLQLEDSREALPDRVGGRGDTRAPEFHQP